MKEYIILTPMNFFTRRCHRKFDTESFKKFFEFEFQAHRTRTIFFLLCFSKKDLKKIQCSSIWFQMPFLNLSCDRVISEVLRNPTRKRGLSLEFENYFRRSSKQLFFASNPLWLFIFIVVNSSSPTFWKKLRDWESVGKLWEQLF